MKNLPFLVTLAFLFFQQFWFAQQVIPLNEKKYVDSLQNVLQQKIPDSAKAHSYLLLADYFKITEPKKAKAYLKSAAPLIKNHTTMQARYYFYKALADAPEDPTLANEIFDKGKSILKEKKDSKSLLLLSSLLYNSVIIQKNKKGYPYILKVLTEDAIPLAEKTHNYQKIGHLYAQLGNILTYNAEFEKAELYLSKSRNMLEKHAPNTTELLIAYLNSCMNFCYQSQGPEANKMLNQAENIIKNYPNSINYPLFLYNKMLYEITIQEYKNGLKTADLGIKLAAEKKQKFLLQMFYFNKYDMLRKSNQPREAKKILLDILADKTLVADANNKKTVYAELTQISESLGQTQDALHWSKKYAKISDSLNDSKMKLELNLLETKFRTLEKEKLLAQKNLQLSQKTSWIWLLGGFSTLLLLAGLSLYFYLSNKRKLTEQREIILAQKLKEQEKNHELLVTRAILEGEEKERQRVAQDLHDGIGGMLAGIKMNFSTWGAQNLETQKQESFSSLLQHLDHSITELRTVARNLMPESLLKFGLEKALQDLCSFYSKPDLEIEFQSINIKNTLPQTAQIHIYRIVQELLTNAVKHAHAKSIFVQCSQSDSQFFITVEDDGIGISPTDKDRQKGLGFKNLKNRVDFLNGKMEVSSENNKGTVVNIELNHV